MKDYIVVDNKFYPDSQQLTVEKSRAIDFACSRKLEYLDLSNAAGLVVNADFLPQSLKSFYANGNSVKRIDFSNCILLKEVRICTNLNCSILNGFIPDNVYFLALYNDSVSFIDLH